MRRNQQKRSMTAKGSTLVCYKTPFRIARPIIMPMIFLILSLLFPANILFATENEQDLKFAEEYLTVPFNVSFTPGLSVSEDRAQGRKVINHFSLNIIAGRAARLKGAEAGLIYNHYTEEIEGAQWAGIMNRVDGSVKGLQYAGIVNKIKGEYTGLQEAGILNLVDASFWGIQTAGIFNRVSGKFFGIQGAGIANLIREEMVGIQGAGILNKVDGSYTGLQGTAILNFITGRFSGVQGSGIANRVQGDFKGIQGAGIVNKLDGQFSGFQGAGIINLLDRDMKGVQAAGIINILGGKLQGMQIAYLFNKASVVAKGVQIGAINFADENRGIPVGLISIVKNYRFHYDLWMDETEFIQVGLRSGTAYFHNLITFGVQNNDPMRWSIGWGIGSHFDLSRNSYFELDGHLQHINENRDQWTTKLNALGKLRFIFGYRLADFFSLYAGPTLNVFVSQVNNGKELAPWTLYKSFETEEELWQRSWIGFVLGVRF